MHLFYSIGRRRIVFIYVKDKEYSESKHVFRHAASGEIWTQLTSIAEAVVRLTRNKERALREVRERFHAKQKNSISVKLRNGLIEGGMV